MCFFPRHFFEIFNNTSASQSGDSDSKAGGYTFNTSTVFVHIYTLSTEFRHNLASSCHSISDFMEIFFCDSIFVEKKKSRKMSQNSNL